MALTYLAAGGITGPARPAGLLTGRGPGVVLAVLMAALIPLILVVPDHHGRW